jgi:MFS transporter, DHA1 family, multidrug resistance protein
MTQNKLNLWILFFTLVVVMLGFGIIIPIMPFYIKEFGAGGSAMGGLMATYGVMQLIFAPIWGSLSDRYGRKPILLIGIIGNALSQFIMGFSTELWMLFAARALAGILSSATLPTAMAYVSDNSSEKERGGGMGMVGAAMGLGMVIGPGLGGLLGDYSLHAPFFLAGGLSLAAMALVWTLLPEAPQRAAAAGHRLQGLNFQALWDGLKGPLGVLFVISFLLSFGITNFESVFGLYTADRYAYTAAQVGSTLMVIGLLSALVQGGLTGPLTRRFGENKIIQAALLLSGIGFLWMTLAQDSLQVLLTVSFFVACNAMLNPATAALISRRTEHGQGMTMGLNNAFLSLGRIIGPLWAGFMYDQGRNLPYYSGALVMLLGLLISLRWLRAK